MKERKISINLHCGLNLVAEVLYGKWKIDCLGFINEGHQRPSELQRTLFCVEIVSQTFSSVYEDHRSNQHSIGFFDVERHTYKEHPFLSEKLI